MPALADASGVRRVGIAVAGAAVPGVVVVLTGLGGVGKTQLAAWHARQALGRGRLDVLVWVDAAGRDAVLSAYAGAAAELTGVRDSDPSRGAARLLAWLAGTDKRWLVVLDDVLDPAHLRGLWPDSTSTAHRSTAAGEIWAEDAVDALRCLHRLSLARLEDTTAWPVIAVHTLLQRVVREALPPARHADAVRACAQALTNIWPFPESSREASALLRASATAVTRVGSGVLWGKRGASVAVALRAEPRRDR